MPFYEKVLKLGVQRKAGFVYYITEEGDVCGIKLGDPNSKTLIKGCGKIEEEYNYFLDEDGDIARTPKD